MPLALAGPSQHPPTLLNILTLVECPPNMPPMLLNILTLVECPPKMPPTLLTILMLGVPSQNASNAPLTLA
ncbi:hypothetical protein O181_103527 [Austropuccinia psidii MF-1]|uniref:Uncharacterized protein n=1 Tax=Austropuccinia psidii MF-1 TaxID=1389203 RepID=A0A9Q3PKI9_9BASI|nr:hypothetical protein [Austropuccinia psidii MF-1]